VAGGKLHGDAEITIEALLTARYQRLAVLAHYRSATCNPQLFVYYLYSICLKGSP